MELVLVIFSFYKQENWYIERMLGEVGEGGEGKERDWERTNNVWVPGSSPQDPRMALGSADGPLSYLSALQINPSFCLTLFGSLLYHLLLKVSCLSTLPSLCNSIRPCPGSQAAARCLWTPHRPHARPAHTLCWSAPAHTAPSAL